MFSNAVIYTLILKKRGAYCKSIGENANKSLRVMAWLGNIKYKTFQFLLTACWKVNRRLCVEINRRLLLLLRDNGNKMIWNRTRSRRIEPCEQWNRSQCGESQTQDTKLASAKCEEFFGRSTHLLLRGGERSAACWIWNRNEHSLRTFSHSQMKLNERKSRYAQISWNHTQREKCISPSLSWNDGS